MRLHIYRQLRLLEEILHPGEGDVADGTLGLQGGCKVGKVQLIAILL